jgi:hypothetical protein
MAKIVCVVLLVLSWVLGGGLVAPTAAASNAIVTSGDDAGPGSLRQAIADAAPGDTITFAPSVTTVTLTTAELTIAKDLTIQGGSQGGVRVERSAQTGTPEFRLFHITAGTVTISGLTVANGKTGPDDVQTASEAGGGMRVSGGNLLLFDSVIRDNTAYVGGGLASVGPGTITATRVSIQGNSAIFGAGAANCRGTLLLADTLIDGNHGIPIASWFIYSEGGGLFNYRGALTLTDTIVSDNTAHGPGGGIANRHGMLSLSDSTVRGNSAGSGGGIESYGGDYGSSFDIGPEPVATLTNVTISDNYGGGYGGGLATGLGQANLTNVTISRNRASDSSGITTYRGQVNLDHVTLVPYASISETLISVHGDGDTQGRIAMRRSIVVGMTTQFPDCEVYPNGTLISEGYNIAGPGCPSDGPGDLAFTGTLTDVLAPTLVDNGGPTQTHALALGSPARDRVPADQCGVPTDQRGVSRPQGAGCDAGAYEHVSGPCANFTDVPDTDPACPAIATLINQGIINGYATTPPTFGPDDDVQRAQMAAFLVRALNWQGQSIGPRTFTDFGGLVAELRAASLILANACAGSSNNCVIQGYGDGRFGPTNDISYAQVITFIARAFQLDDAYRWTPYPNASQPYSGVPAVHDAEIRTYVHNAGAIPDAPTTPEGWNAPAPRAWVALVLYQALQSRP